MFHRVNGAHWVSPSTRRWTLGAASTLYLLCESCWCEHGGVPTPLWVSAFNPLGPRPPDGTVGLYGGCIFKYLRNPRTVFRNQGLHHFVFPPTVREDSGFTPSLPMLVIVWFCFFVFVFFDSSILMCVRLYLTARLTFECGNWGRGTSRTPQWEIHIRCLTLQNLPSARR